MTSAVVDFIRNPEFIRTHRKKATDKGNKFAWLTIENDVVARLPGIEKTVVLCDGDWHN
jgi:hypothetical protein